MTKNEQEAVIKTVITVLLGNEAEWQSAHYSAIGRILKKMKPSQDLVDFTIKKCLRIYEKNKNVFADLSATAALEAATKFVDKASEPIIEKVVWAAAEQGWYVKVEQLANVFLIREPTAKEIMALVDNYVNDKARRAEHEEKDLLQMTKRCRPAILSEVQRKIDQFIEYWDKNSGSY